mmetsp:Transcript_26875/g.88183  ORF Transcript_26875/g.88183 Transcript_26875/m.88183 type:complete len:309 (-) Transcript_26875:993-1919(-)
MSFVAHPGRSAGGGPASLAETPSTPFAPSTAAASPCSSPSSSSSSSSIGPSPACAAAPLSTSPVKKPSDAVRLAFKKPLFIFCTLTFAFTCLSAFCRSRSSAFFARSRWSSRSFSSFRRAATSASRMARSFRYRSSCSSRSFSFSSRACAFRTRRSSYSFCFCSSFAFLFISRSIFIFATCFCFSGSWYFSTPATSMLLVTPTSSALRLRPDTVALPFFVFLRFFLVLLPVLVLLPAVACKAISCTNDEAALRNDSARASVPAEPSSLCAYRPMCLATIGVRRTCSIVGLLVASRSSSAATKAESSAL